MASLMLWKPEKPRTETPSFGRPKMIPNYQDNGEMDVADKEMGLSGRIG